MKEKYIFDDFKSYKSSHDKYYDLGSYMKVDKLGFPSYNDINELYKYYKADKSTKREETPEEREARLLREKAVAREVKIDEILKK
jgi:hypothetical protein